MTALGLRGQACVEKRPHLTRHAAIVQVWFQLGNTLFPGGRAAITTHALSEAGDLVQDVAAWHTQVAGKQ
jgi:hypothetical protein